MLNIDVTFSVVPPWPSSGADIEDRVTSIVAIKKDPSAKVFMEFEDGQKISTIVSNTSREILLLLILAVYPKLNPAREPTDPSCNVAPASITIDVNEIVNSPSRDAFDSIRLNPTRSSPRYATEQRLFVYERT